jgi:hypothetical protein
MCISSMPASTEPAAQNKLKLSIGLVTRLMARWSCSTMLLRYLTWRTRIGPARPALIHRSPPCSRRSCPARPCPDSRSLPWPYRPRALRHTFGTLAVADGMLIDVAQAVLGHKDSATIAIYVQAKVKRVVEEGAKYFAKKRAKVSYGDESIDEAAYLSCIAVEAA